MKTGPRAVQAVLIVSMLLASWLGMQQVHELGHVLGAGATGGKVQRVVLHPLTISRTDLAENPRPLETAWAGPLFGSAAPLCVWAVAAAVGLRGDGLAVLRFFAGFCLAANGLYLGLGSFDRVGDCGDLLNHGAAVWQLWLFGAVATPLGLFLWHGLGADFGLGPAGREVHPRTAFAMLGVFLGLLAAGFAVGGE